MASEPFVEVEASEMPKVFKALEANWPNHFVLDQTLKVLADYKKAGCTWKHPLYLYGDYDNGVYLITLTVELTGREVIFLYIDTTSSDLTEMRKALRETMVIPWEKKNYHFIHVNGKFSGLIQCELAAHGVKCGVYPNTMFWFPPNKECKLESLPDDLEVEFLDGSYAQEMDKNWPYRSPGTEILHRESLEKNFGLGLFRKSDRLLIGSALCNYTGGIFLLYCAPEFRGRGYASILVQHMVQEIKRRGWIPFATVILGNKPSEHVFRKTGFEVFSEADFLIAKKE